MDSQSNITIPSLTQIYDEDPNAQKNRILADDELLDLRVMKETHIRLANTINEEVERARHAHEALVQKYQEQIRTLEATQSQLHASKRSLDILVAQQPAQLAEAERLSGLIHPIRRLPSDILQYLFESAYSAKDKEDRFFAALTLSQVCQRWRAIALNTPRLWCYIDYVFQDGIDPESFWGWVIPRVKAVPADIVLHELNPDKGATVDACGLSRIRTIQSLTLRTYISEDFSCILPAPISLPMANDGSISIHYDTVAPHPTLDMGNILSTLPPISKLTLDAGCELRITPTISLQNLTFLRLEYLEEVDISTILLLCTSLLHLRLESILETPTAATAPATSHSLQTLQFRSVEDDQWWPLALSCPDLTALHHGDDNFEECLPFLESHPSIVTLDTSANDSWVTRAIAIAPQIQYLTLEASELHLLCEWQASEQSRLAFPSLKQLQVSIIGEPLSIVDFERIVRTRCLPTTHSASLALPGCTPLGSFSVTAIKKTEEWRSSELSIEATHSFYIDQYREGYQMETLSWK